MPTSAVVCTISLFLASITAIAQSSSQAGADEQHAREQLRAITDSIKTCPPKMYQLPPEATLASQGFLVTDGPPSNVMWKVEPNPSGRTPLLGSVEYVFPFSEMPPANLCDKVKHKRDCELAAHQFFEHYKQEDANPRQYRFEFDIATDGLEFVGSFSKTKQTDDEPWLPGGTDFCGRRAIHLVLGDTGASK
jgi:hypothetical protein